MSTPAKRRAVTIIDVAREAGVSVATASRALGGYGYSARQTRERVQEAARRLGYQPDRVARSMITGRTSTIGVLVADVENLFFAQATRAIGDAARDAGYDVILSNTDERLDSEQAAMRLLRGKRVDGVIVSPTSSVDIDHLLAAKAAGCHVVLMDRRVPPLGVDTVAVDNFVAAYEAVRHLVDQGHRRIAVASNAVGDGISQPYISSVAERFDGYRAALRSVGVPAADEILWVGGWGTDTATCDQRWDTPTRPTAVLATDSLVALGVLLSARRAGLRTPEDVSLVSFDNTPWSEALDPPLTVVAQPVREMGAQATTMLLERIAGHAGPPRELLLNAPLIERRSVRPPGAG